MVFRAATYKRGTLFLVFLFSICYLSYLILTTPANVFFSGDGGVKSLVVKQVECGEGFKYLHLDQPGWVRDIWSTGYFPFRKPFVYPSAGGYVFSFPPLFQVLNSFFYHTWGYKGLYVFPFFSALCLWVLFSLLLLRCGLSLQEAALALAVLVFATPLTIYGAIYWEHMPAVLLLFGGVWVLLDPRLRLPVSMLSGVASGMAVWLRPEAIVLNFLYGLAALVLYARRGRSGVYLAFAVSLVPPVIAFLVFNKLEYGTLLGVHSYQVLEEHSVFFKIAKAGYEWLLINWTNVLYFPWVVLLVVAAYRLARKKWEPALSLQLLWWVAFVFCLVSPLLMPNAGGRQWGARYLLPVVPLVIVAGALSWKSIRNAEGHFPRWVPTALSLIFAYSFVVNTVVGGYQLRQSNRERVKPAYDFVSGQPQEVILVSSENVPMEFASLFDRRYFFLVPADTSLQRLVPLLKARGITSCLYIGEEARHPALLNRLNEDSSLVKKGNYYFGRYDLP